MSLIDQSFMISLGGQGNASGWSLENEPGRQPLGLPDAALDKSARTTLVVTWAGDRPAIHSLVGRQFESEILGVLGVGESGTRLVRPGLAFDIPVLPGRYVAYYASYAANPSGFGDVADPDHGSSIVTVWIHLAPVHSFAPIDSQPGHGMVLRLDEMGMVLCHPPIVDRLLNESRADVESAGGILEAIGRSFLGESMIDAGGFFPIWGSRPWIYRLASSSLVETVCPLGNPTAEPYIAYAPEMRSELKVVAGASLRGAIDIDWDRWPSIRLPGDTGDGLSLKIESFVSGGPEPIDPRHAVGIIPTILLSRSMERPAEPNSTSYPFTEHDPFEAYGSPKFGCERVWTTVAAEPTAQ